MNDDTASESSGGSAVAWGGLLPLIVGAVPLLAYPMVLVANMMQLAAFQGPAGQNVSFGEALPILGFLVMTTAYPVALVGSAWRWWILKGGGKPIRAIAWSCVPLAYLAGAAALFVSMLEA